MDYYFREAFDNQNTPYHLVAKFDPIRNGPPIEVYRLFYNDTNSLWHCTCPSPKLPCKHADMLVDWLKLANRIRYYWDDDKKLFQTHLFYEMNGNNSLSSFVKGNT